MLIENLSDYAREQLSATEAQQDLVSDGIGRALERRQAAEDAYRTAGRAKPIWKRLLGIKSPAQKEARAESASAQRDLQAAQARKIHLLNKTQQQAAGVQGEEELVARLAGELSDDWQAFQGYQNRRGEADLVLVGPPGVWLVEVKNRNARLYIDGDQWHYEKLDRFGNVVKSGAATDGSGRVWGRQASDVAHDLAGWLDKNHHRVGVRTAVMVVHERASVARMRNPGVDLVSASPSELLLAMTTAPAELTPEVRRAIAALIRRDHKYHNGSRKKRT